MILGAPYWNEGSRLHVQTNNPTEEQIEKDGLRPYLETCGPTASVNCLDALGVDILIECPGMYIPQSEEVLNDFLNDPVNYPRLSKILPGVDPNKVHGNRVPDYYPLAVADVFATEGKFYQVLKWDGIVAELKEGHAVQICIKVPGHYLAAVAYDDATEEIIYHDSWPKRTKTNGFALRMKRGEYDSNVKDCVVVYTGKKAV